MLFGIHALPAKKYTDLIPVFSFSPILAMIRLFPFPEKQVLTHARSTFSRTTTSNYSNNRSLVNQGDNGDGRMYDRLRDNAIVNSFLFSTFLRCKKRK